MSRQIERRTLPGKNLVPGVGVHPGSYTELCWIPVDELLEPDPRFAKHWEEDKADYAAHIADQPCYGSLHRAVRWLTGDAPKYRSDGTPVVVLPAAGGDETEREPGGSGVVLG